MRNSQRGAYQHLTATSARTAKSKPSESRGLQPFAQHPRQPAVQNRRASELPAPRSRLTPYTLHCRSASYDATATAFERFRLRTSARVGIRSCESVGWASSSESGRPADSLPKTSTSAGWNRASRYDRSAFLVKSQRPARRQRGLQFVPVVDDLPFEMFPIVEPGSAQVVVVDAEARAAGPATAWPRRPRTCGRRCPCCTESPADAARRAAAVRI